MCWLSMSGKHSVRVKSSDPCYCRGTVPYFAETNVTEGAPQGLLESAENTTPWNGVTTLELFN